MVNLARLFRRRPVCKPLSAQAQAIIEALESGQRAAQPVITDLPPVPLPENPAPPRN